MRSYCVLLGFLAVAGLAEPAVAKEPLAGCPGLSGALERMRTTMLLASIHRGRGSAMGAYQVLWTSATSLAADKTVAACGVVPQILRKALQDADTRTTANQAGQALDMGFAAALSLALGGTVSAELMVVKEWPVDEATVLGAQCRDVFQLTRKLRHAQTPLAQRVAETLGELKGKTGCTDLFDTLSTKPEKLSASVDAVVLDERVATMAQVNNPLSRCPELPAVLERLQRTIATGAPLYNKGDHSGCRQVYLDATVDLTETLLPPGRCPFVRSQLDQAKKEAAAAGAPGPAAWALRRGFDRIAQALAGQAGGKNQPQFD